MSIIREYEKKDVPALVALWSKTFGDPPEFVEMFYDMLPDMGSCVVLESDGKIVAMASVLAGQELQFKNSLKKPECGYIYAVAVDADFRDNGYGAEITKAAYDLALKREAMIVCTCPANESLFEFYKKTLGLEPVLFRSKHEVIASDTEMTMKLTSTEYSVMRESILNGSTYLRLSNFSFEFVKKMYEMYGGGLFASMSGICIASKDDETCYIYELISQNNEATASSVAYALGCKKAVFYLPDPNGKPFIAAEPGKIDPKAIWNIAYE